MASWKNPIPKKSNPEKIPSRKNQIPKKSNPGKIQPRKNPIPKKSNPEKIQCRKNPVAPRKNLRERTIMYLKTEDKYPPEKIPWLAEKMICRKNPAPKKRSVPNQKNPAPKKSSVKQTCTEVASLSVHRVWIFSAEKISGRTHRFPYRKNDFFGGGWDFFWDAFGCEICFFGKPVELSCELPSCGFFRQKKSPDVAHIFSVEKIKGSPPYFFDFFRQKKSRAADGTNPGWSFIISAGTSVRAGSCCLHLIGGNIQQIWETPSGSAERPCARGPTNWRAGWLTEWLASWLADGFDKHIL